MTAAHAGDPDRNALADARLLVVGKDADRLRAVLERAGARRIDTADSPQSAAAALHDAAFDALLAGPDARGPAALEALRAESGDAAPTALRVRFMRGRREPASREHGVLRLPWPIEPVALRRQLGTALRLLRATRERDAMQLELRQAVQMRARLEADLRRAALHDPLTGLLREGPFMQELTAALASGHACSLLLLNLDRFRRLRAEIGESGGHALLRATAMAMEEHLGADVRVAHCGGDEFVAMLGATPEVALERAERLRLGIGALDPARGSPGFGAAASIGVTACISGEAAGDALRRARHAAHVARLRGGNRVHDYREDDPELLDEREQARVSRLLRDALRGDGLQLVFQPVMRIGDGCIDHYEALLRMLDVDGSLLTPERFIPIAERTGLIRELDRWVVANALACLGRLHDVRDELGFHINLSGRAFEDDGLLAHVCGQLRLSGVHPQRVTFEITETSAIANFDAVRRMVGALRKVGCRFALDDFGAGFASFNYLRELEVDLLKIDGGFIRALATNATDQMLVRAMVDIARRLGKQTIAEFVHDAPTLELLAGYGVDYAQGFHVGRPSAALLPRRLSLSAAPAASAPAATADAQAASGPGARTVVAHG